MRGLFATARTSLDAVRNSRTPDKAGQPYADVTKSDTFSLIDPVSSMGGRNGREPRHIGCSARRRNLAAHTRNLTLSP